MAQITITWNDANTDDLKSGLFALCPKPDGVSVLEHAENLIRGFIITEYKRGKTHLAKNAAVINNNILEE